MKPLREARRLLNRLGYDIVPFDPERRGIDATTDIRNLLRSDRPMIFDVGANIGQTVERFRLGIPGAVIHAFEPSPATFAKLKNRVGGFQDVMLWKCALGASQGRLKLFENTYSDMSSFLPLGRNGWGEIKGTEDVDVTTIDHMAQSQGISRIDVLKCDAQGFDLEVLKGAEVSIRAGVIGLLLLEVTLTELYKSAPSLSEVLTFVTSRGFQLVTIYKFRYQGPVASWTDALFVHESYLDATMTRD